MSIKNVIGILIIAISITNCKKEDKKKEEQQQQQQQQQSYPQGSIIVSVPLGLITSSTAISGGNITSDGNTAIQQRGVCWDTSPMPTYTLSHTSDGTSAGTFSSLVTGLTPNTVYYLRAYSKNAVGVSYGAEQTFTTNSIWTEVATIGLRGLYAKGSVLFGIEDATNIIKKSTDNGVTWNNANTGITGTPQQFIDDGTNLFVTCLTGGVYVSSNDGATWQQRINGTFSSVMRCLCTGTYGIYMGTNDGVFWTSDAGMNWNSSALTSGTVLSIAAETTGRMIAGLTTGVEYSDQYGSNFFNATNGIAGNQASCVARMGTSHFLVTTSNGTYITADGGSSWTFLSWLNGGQEYFISKGNTTFAAVDYREMYLTKNAGATWTSINDGIGILPSNGSIAISTNYLYLSRLADGKLYRKTY